MGTLPAGVESETENEYKVMLSKEQFDHLKDFFPKIAEEKSSYVQTNYYFDTKDHFFTKNGITFRIRHKLDKYQMQIKIFNKENMDQYNQHLELNQNITKDEAEQYINDGIESNFLAIFAAEAGLAESTDRLSYIGKLETKRHDYLFYSDVISLDENHYLGTIDYELEWETSNFKFVEYQLNNLNLKPMTGTGKITRFVERLECFPQFLHKLKKT